MYAQSVKIRVDSLINQFTNGRNYVFMKIIYIIYHNSNNHSNNQLSSECEI